MAEAITAFLLSSTVMGTREAPVDLGRVSIYVSIKSGRGRDGTTYALVLSVQLPFGDEAMCSRAGVNAWT